MRTPLFLSTCLALCGFSSQLSAADVTVTVDTATTFNATVLDQFGDPMEVQPTISWETTVGSLSATQGASTDLLAPSVASSGAITATSGSLSEIKTIDVVETIPEIASDDFESGDFSGGTGWDSASWSASAFIAQVDGDNVVRFREKKRISRLITIPAGFSGDLQYEITNSGSSNTYRYFQARLKIDGVNTVLDRYSGLKVGESTTVSIPLDDFAGQSGTLEFFFSANSSSHRMDLDDVVITNANGPVDPVDLPPVVDAGDNDSLQLVGGIASVILAGSASDDNVIISTEWTASGPAAVSFDDSSLLTATASFTVAGTYTLTLTADDGVNELVSDTKEVIVEAEVIDLPPVVDAGLNDSTQLAGGTASVALDGSVSDDGAVAVLWSASGPGAVSFADATAIDTAATFTAAGTYALTLTADDGVNQPVSDSKQVVVEDEIIDLSPIVDAGLDDNAELADGTATITLAGTVSDDGAVTAMWTASGPGSVIFADASAVDTRATFIVDGSYILTLTADDSVNPAVSDTITVTVAPEPIDTAPVVNAGDDLQTTLIADLAVVDLNAVVTDDGPVTTLWEASGPGPVAFTDASAAATTASFTLAGVYTVTITADDGVNPIVSDSLTVTVDPEPVTGPSLASDDFESGDFTGGTGWDTAEWTGSAFVNLDGDYAVRFREKKRLQRVVTLPQDFTGDIAYTLTNVGSRNAFRFFQLELVVDGTRTVVDRTNNIPVGESREVVVPLDDYAGETVTLRFFFSANSSDDLLDFDDVAINVVELLSNG